MLPFSWSSKWVRVITSQSVSWRSHHLVIPRILVVPELSSVIAQRLACFEIAFFSPFHHGSQSKYFWVWNNVSLYEYGSWHQNTAPVPFRSHSTSCWENKGWKGAFFYIYHTIIVLSFFLSFVLNVELFCCFVQIWRRVWMKYSSVEKRPLLGSPQSNSRYI